MKNIKIIRKKAADKYFLRNFHLYNDDLFDQKIVNLIKINNVKADKVLEIGCANGNKLNQYSKLLKSKKPGDVIEKCDFEGDCSSRRPCQFWCRYQHPILCGGAV